jgi:hypothetical protein
MHYRVESFAEYQKLVHLAHFLHLPPGSYLPHHSHQVLNQWLGEPHQREPIPFLVSSATNVNDHIKEKSNKKFKKDEKHTETGMGV